jgi:hypothetical protein
MQRLCWLIVSVCALACDGKRDVAMPPGGPGSDLPTHKTSVDHHHTTARPAAGADSGAMADFDAGADGATPSDTDAAPPRDAGVLAPDAGSLSDVDRGSPDAGRPPEDAGAALDTSATHAHGGQRRAGSDAGSGTVNPPANGLTYLNDADRGADILIESDRLSAQWLTLGTEGVRSTRSIAPGEGVFYYEAHIPAPFNMLTIGVATAAAPLDLDASANAQSFGIDSGGTIAVNGTWSQNFDSGNVDFGFVLDYRATPAIVHVIATANGQPAIVRSQSLAAISQPLFIYLAGIRRTTETQVTINAGNDTTNAPFVYAPADLLRAAGLADTADALVMGWGATHAGTWNAPPTLVPPSGTTVSAGTAVTLSGQASDIEDGSLSATIEWEDLATGSGTERVRGTGASFTFTPQVMGIHPVRMTVIDSGGKRARQSIDVVALGTLAQNSDVRMTPDAKSGSGIVVSSDGLSVHWTADGKNGVRANQALYGAFWYFEAQRLVPPVNQGIGLVIGNVSLNPYPFNVTPPSCSVNTGAGVYQDLIFKAGLSDATSLQYYGFAVDYRGRYPIVYVVLGGAVTNTLNLTDATVPIYPMLYGNPTGAGVDWDVSINFGGTAFHYDAKAALGAAGIDASSLRMCWGAANAACTNTP